MGLHYQSPQQHVCLVLGKVWVVMGDYLGAIPLCCPPPLPLPPIIPEAASLGELPAVASVHGRGHWDQGDIPPDLGDCE